MSPSRPLLQELVFRAIGLPLPPLKQAEKPTKTGFWCTEQLEDNDQSRWRREQPSPFSGKFVDPSQRLLSRDEIQRMLRRFRYDDEFRGDKRVPIKALGDFVGLSRDTVHTSLRTGEMSQRTRTLLSWAILAIMEGKLRFRRHRQVWKAEGDGAMKMLEDPRWRRRSQVWSSPRKKL
jgi:hypothetical protein